MTEYTTFTFRIKNFGPQSLPFARLVEYYSQIKLMSGVSEKLYLVDIVEASHGSQFVIDRTYEDSLNERMKKIRNRTAPRNALSAYDRINSMLGEDGTSGSFSDIANENVIRFPGDQSQADQELRIKDAASLTGELYHISGTKNEVRVRLNTPEFGVVFCNTSHDIAKQLRDYLFETVRVNGRGVWTRLGPGQWDIDSVQITDFTPIKFEDLRKSVDRIRKLNISWPKDPLREIAIVNKDGDELN